MKKILIIISVLVFSIGFLFLSPKMKYQMTHSSGIVGKILKEDNFEIRTGSISPAKPDNSMEYKFPLAFEQKYPVVISSLKKSVNTSGLEISDVDFEVDSLNLGSKPGSYFNISVKDNHIKVVAKSEEGLINGSTRLTKELEKATNRGLPANLNIEDWSKLDTRAVHIVTGAPFNLPNLKRCVDVARDNYFNTLIILITNSVELKNLNTGSVRKKWSKNELEQLIAYARQSGLRVIPSMKFLSHQEKLLSDKYPLYLLNQLTYNPFEKDIYPEVIYPIIDEVVDMSQPDMFGIGHDEVLGYNNYSKVKEIMKSTPQLVTPNGFLLDVKNLNTYLNGKNITTLMWADMLLNPKDFPTMRTNLLHGVDGFDKLIDSIPKNIILCDWHYKDQQKDFPSYTYLTDKGFEVWGATWDDPNTTRNFADYVARSNATKKGMIATTWKGINKYLPMIEQIIIQSGRIFWSEK